MRSKLVIALLAAFVAISPLRAQITFGRPEKINDGWKFALNPGEDCSAVDYDDSGWRTLDLPHDWSVEFPISSEYASCTGYLPGGEGWYRKVLNVPASEKGRRLWLYFGGVYNNSEVWVNGERVGYRPNGYVSFIYDVTEKLRPGKGNVIAVKVDHTKDADSRWYTGSGIYRDVYLVSSAQTHIGNWGVFARTLEVREDGSALIGVSVNVVNDGEKPASVKIVNRLRRREALIAESVAPVGLPAGRSWKAENTLLVKYPELWSVDSPALYELETIILDAKGNKIDGTKVKVGIRTTRFDADNGFFLNGKNMKLKGVCLHHDAGSLGAVVPEDVWRRRLKTLKEIGCNAIRMSHNPQAEILYDLCDEMGFLVMDECFDEWEFPKRKWIEGWNVGDNPGLQGYSEYFNEWAETDLRSMVERDKNHPSIIMWSIGNEVDYPNDPYSHPILDHEGITQKTIPGYQPDRPAASRIGDIAKRLVPVVKSIDTSRAVTGAMAGVVMSNHTDYPGALDVTGYNYTEHRYIKDHIEYPERVIYGSENRHDYEAWLAVRDNDHICGQFLWTGIDYLGESGRFPSRGFVSGLLGLDGEKKPRGWYRQSLWSDKPMVYAGTMPASQVKAWTSFIDREDDWNYRDGEKITVAVFTNCKTAELELNGVKIGDKPRKDLNSNALLWDIAYEEGELKVNGLNDGEVVSTAILKTYGAPAALQVKTDKNILNGADRIAHMTLEIVDANGVRVRDARHKVVCEVSGDCSFIRMENADPQYTGSFLGNELPVYNGRILAYVRSDKAEGKAKVTFRVPELGLEKSIDLEIRTTWDFDPETTMCRTYRTDPDLNIYFIYPHDIMPRKGENLPAIVFFFGGGWRTGTVHQFASRAREIADLGMVCVLADYRVSSRFGTDPFASVEDAKSVMRYVRSHAAELRIDPDRIAASGGSAGGHLAASTALVEGFDSPTDDLSVSPRPNALVLFNPVFNNAPAPEGYGYTRISSRFPQFSPYHNIRAGAPPTLIMVGTADHLIPVSTSKAYKARMDEVGSRCELHLYEGVGHGFYQQEGYYRQTLDTVIAFLRSLGYIN